jgi:predicted RNA-binding Zn-ribbon protein involved in translation (DUF1610 family)
MVRVVYVLKMKLQMPIYFVLCSSCYWCASDIDSKSKFTKCPSCGSVEVESMPIAKNQNVSMVL